MVVGFRIALDALVECVKAGDDEFNLSVIAQLSAKKLTGKFDRMTNSTVVQV